MKEDTDAVDPDEDPDVILADTIAEATMTPTETIPGHSQQDTPHRSSSHRSSSAYSRDCSRSYKPARKTSHQNSS